MPLGHLSNANEGSGKHWGNIKPNVNDKTLAQLSDWLNYWLTADSSCASVWYKYVLSSLKQTEITVCTWCFDCKKRLLVGEGE